jgi:hypothetical protein
MQAPSQRIILLIVYHHVLRHIDTEESLVEGEVDHIGVHGEMLTSMRGFSGSAV